MFVDPNAGIVTKVSLIEGYHSKEDHLSRDCQPFLQEPLSYGYN